MASKKSSGASPTAYSKEQNAMMGEIQTAAKSTMEPCDYSQGYPPNAGRVLNANFGGRSKAAGGK